MMMRLFLGNLLPAEETGRLLTAYRDRMAARAESFRQARERFSRSLSGPYRDRCSGNGQPGPPDRDDRPGGGRDG